ncbi:alpha/beta fold hydrolase [Achromobacter sp. NPDC058515]|uniref:alpha/beta fold hydrolase n=1 Tax=Achromobacter sp. NPDC058515 TaxID=3346533 RepID=UPI00364B65A3
MDIETRGTGPLRVVAIHGIQGTRSSWMPVVETLADAATWVLPNLRGRGGSIVPRDARDYALGRYADDLEAAIRACCMDATFVLAGWSMGVSVILEYLRRQGAPRPAGLVLASGTDCLAQTSWFKSDGEQLLREAADRERRLGLREAADHAAVAGTWRCIRKLDHRGSLAAIPEPAIVIHGSDDPDSPVAHGLRLASGLQQASRHIIAGAGHGVLTENTAEVSDQIRRFLDSISPAATHNPETVK